MYDTMVGEGGAVTIRVLASGSTTCCRANMEVLHVALPLLCGVGLHMPGLPCRFLRNDAAQTIITRMLICSLDQAGGLLR